MTLSSSIISFVKERKIHDTEREREPFASYANGHSIFVFEEVEIEVKTITYQ